MKRYLSVDFGLKSGIGRQFVHVFEHALALAHIVPVWNFEIVKDQRSKITDSVAGGSRPGRSR